MPFIHIRSLPRPNFDATAAASEVSADFARAAGVDEVHVTVTWQWLDAHVEEGREAPTAVLVDLHAPDFNSAEEVESMLRAAADAVARAAGAASNEVFVSYSPARSGAVFDDGEIVRW